jgi:hypothetical protein
MCEQYLFRDPQKGSNLTSLIITWLFVAVFVGTSLPTFAAKWTYTEDSIDDSSGIFGKVSNKVFEIYAIAVKIDRDTVTVAINSRLPMGGVSDHGVQSSWGDFIFDFDGIQYGIRFDELNDTTVGSATLGLYKDVVTKSVSKANLGHRNFTTYKRYIKRRGGTPTLGDIPITNNSYFGNTAKMPTTIDTGTKIDDDGFALLDATQLAAEGLDFAANTSIPASTNDPDNPYDYGSNPKPENELGEYTYGFKFNWQNDMLGVFKTYIFTECACDGILMSSSIDDQIIQTITFGALSNKTYGDANFVVNATGGASGNLVTFDTTGNCSNPGSTVTITDVGSCTVTASQAGNATYAAATDVPQTFTIAKKSITATAENKTRAYGATNPTATFTYTGLVNSDTAADIDTAPTGSSTANATSAVGSAQTITCSGGTDANYNLTTCTQGQLIITKANTTTTFNRDNAAPSVIGQNITVDVSVASTTGTPTGTVTVNDGNSNTCNVTLTSGTGSCVLTPANGNTTLTATYNGDANFNGSNDTEAHASLTAGILVDDGNGISLIEAGTTDTYTLTAITAPASAITITVTADAQTQVSNDGTTFAGTTTVSITDLTAHTITVMALDDSTIEGNHTAQITQAITAGDSGDYSTNLSVSSVNASISDNDAGVVVTLTNGNATEGGATGSFDVVLNTQPANDVTITVSPDSQTTVDKPTLTFTNGDWDTVQTVTVTAVDDSAIENSHSSTISLSATSNDGDYEGAAFSIDDAVASSLLVNITDNDTAPATTPTTTPTSNEPPPLKILNVGINGDGDGVILSKPNGIDCARIDNAICQNEFAMGTKITLTATPAKGSEFIGWSSNCEGVNLPLIVVWSA